MPALTVDELIASPGPKLTVPGLLYDAVEPRPYQIVDAVFALMYPRSLIAEYPGAGKKLITLMAAGKAFETRGARNALIMSIGTDVDQWVEEIQKFTDFSVQLYRGTPKERAYMRGSDVDFRVTTYSTAAADLKYLMGMHDILVADEISYLRNCFADVSFAMRALFAPDVRDQLAYMKMLHHFRDEKRMFKLGLKKKDHPLHRQAFPGWDTQNCSPFAWGLTATPYEVGPMDIFSLYWLIMSRHSPLGVNPNFFKRSYCIVRSYRIRTPRGGRIKIEKVQGLHPDRKDEFKKLIHGTYIRHPWEVVEKYMPALEVLPEWIDMGKKQLARYKEISDGEVIADFVWKEKGKRLFQKDVTFALKHHYQLRCCDGLTSLPGQRFRDSAKLTRCMELLTGEMAGEKVLIFSRFYDPLDQLEKKLDYELIPWARIDGHPSRSDESNKAAQDSFWDPDGARILLITGKAARALNLHCAHYGICYNTLFNPFLLQQIHGRLRRPGNHAILWYHLLCRGTVEEKQWQLIREREQESSDIFGAEQEFFGTLTPSEQAAITAYGHGAL